MLNFCASTHIPSISTPIPGPSAYFPHAALPDISTLTPCSSVPTEQRRLFTCPVHATTAQRPSSPALRDSKLGVSTLSRFRSMRLHSAPALRLTVLFRSVSGRCGALPERDRSPPFRHLARRGRTRQRRSLSERDRSCRCRRGTAPFFTGARQVRSWHNPRRALHVPTSSARSHLVVAVALQDADQSENPGSISSSVYSKIPNPPFAHCPIPRYAPRSRISRRIASVWI